MAVKSIIEVGVNDEKFRAFFDLFQQYQSRVDSLPESWGKVGAATDKNTGAFAALVGETANSVHHASAMVEQLRKATVAQKEFHSAAHGASQTLDKMAKSAESIGKSVFGIGKFLMKMGALGIGAAGLGLFGMDSLGRGAVGGQREARGLGLNQGQVNAFKTDFGRFVDPSMLNKVADAQSSFTGRVYLGMASGLSQSQVQEMGPDQLSIMLAQRASNWWKTTPSALRTEENLKATGFDQSGFSMEDMRRLGNTPSSDLSNAAGQYGTDSGKLRVDDGTVSKWYELTRQLDLAGQKIEKVLVRQLSGLAPILGTLTTKLADDLDVFLTTTLTKENVTAFAESMKTAVAYIGSPEFTQNIKDFGTAVSDVTHLILKVSKFLGGGATNLEDVPGGNVEPGARVIQKGMFGTTAQNKPKNYSLWQNIKDDVHNWGKDRKPDGMPSFADNALRKAHLGSLDAKYGLPKGTMWNLYGAESSHGLDPNSYKENKSGAMGGFGFLKLTGLQYGVRDRNDFYQASDGSAHMVSDLSRHYKFDIRKAAAAYNGGQGNVDSDVNRYGDNWINSPRSQRNGVPAYVQKVVVDIRNAPGNGISAQVAGSK